MEWIHKQLAKDEYDARKRSPPPGVGVAPKSVTDESCYQSNAGYDKTLPEEWCDSGLDSYISSVSISTDAPDSARSTTDAPDSAQSTTDPSWSCGVTPDGGESERLDSAIGDSINDDTVRSLSEGIGTVILTDPVDKHHPGDELYNMLRFLSDDGDTALHLALIHEQWDLFQRLLELVILNPTWSPYLDIQNDLGQSALHLAVVVGGGCGCVRALLRAGASVELQERGGNTALHLAVCEQHADCVREITASPRTLPEHLSVYNYTGVSALHLAVQKGRCDIIRMLLEAGADVNQKDLGSGRSPLHWAVEYQNCGAAELLIRFGSSVDQPSYSGHTPLYCALYRPNARLRELLRAAGASDTYDEEEEEEEEDDEAEEEKARESDEEFDDVILNGKRVL